MTEDVRIPPLREDEWSDAQRAMLQYAYEKGGFYNVIGTLARHEEASARLGQVGAHVLGPTSTLPPRDRELLILRTAWLCRAEYEWAQHLHIGRKAGLRYVYEGNQPGEGGENTYCYQCGALLIERYGFAVRQNRIGANACCPDCGASIDGRGMAGR